MCLAAALVASWPLAGGRFEHDDKFFVTELAEFRENNLGKTLISPQVIQILVSRA